MGRRTTRAGDFDAYVAERLKDPAFAAVLEEEKEKVDLAIRICRARSTPESSVPPSSPRKRGSGSPGFPRSRE